MKSLKKKKIEKQQHKNFQKIFILAGIKKIFIGEIREDTFRIYDTENYHDLSKSLGLDNEIIETPDLKYRWIHIVYEKIDYITTRTFFYHRGTKRKLFNSRDMKFLPLDLFGKQKAIAWEEYMENLQTAQLDIFTILDEQRRTNEDNNEYLREWEEKNKRVNLYQISKKVVL